jgi:hypothetical protein
MATTVREYSLDYYLLDRLRFSGIERENLEDLVGIVTPRLQQMRILPRGIPKSNQFEANVTPGS